MNATATQPPQPTTMQWLLTTTLQLEEAGPEVEREAVTDADLAELRGEAWLSGCLRKGRPELPLAEMKFRILPIFKTAGTSRCGGFQLRAVIPGLEEIRRTYTIFSLSDVAARAAERLVLTGKVRELGTYYFEIHAERETVSAEPPPLFTAVARTKPLQVVKLPLPSLLKQARAHGTESREHYPVFYTEEALAKAERFARKGAERTKPVETGGMLLGPLCACPETGEFFAIVRDVLEVLDAEEKKFSLSYSGKTWERIQTVVRTIQANPATAAFRLLGQCHGHNFVPGGKPCDDCQFVKECSKSSVFVSLDDRQWSRAVFAGQPWQLCHIFGLNARGEGVQRLYGLRDGRLEERGYYIIPELPALV